MRACVRAFMWWWWCVRARARVCVCVGACVSARAHARVVTAALWTRPRPLRTHCTDRPDPTRCGHVGAQQRSMRRARRPSSKRDAARNERRPTPVGHCTRCDAWRSDVRACSCIARRIGACRCCSSSAAKRARPTTASSSTSPAGATWRPPRLFQVPCVAPSKVGPVILTRYHSGSGPDPALHRRIALRSLVVLCSWCGPMAAARTGRLRCCRYTAWPTAHAAAGIASARGLVARAARIDRI